MSDLQIRRVGLSAALQRSGQVALRLLELPAFLVMAMLAMVLALVRFFRS